MLNIDKNLPIKISTKIISDIKVSGNNSAYLNLEKIAEGYFNEYNDIPVSEITNIQNARRFFRAIGVDPTKRRPSSEALLRRALKQKDLYHVNNLVDVGNWCSLEFLLPICVYDLNKIVGDTIIRIGSSEDKYLGISHREISWENKFVICDEIGAYGSPITDSVRTSITPETTETMLIIFAPEDYPQEELDSIMEIFEERVNQYCK